MFGYKSNEDFGLYINFYKETGVNIYRLRYEDLIREAVDSGAFQKSYKSKFVHKLKFASMPRDACSGAFCFVINSGFGVHNASFMV